MRKNLDKFIKTGPLTENSQTNKTFNYIKFDLYAKLMLRKFITLKLFSVTYRL